MLHARVPHLKELTIQHPKFSLARKFLKDHTSFTYLDLSVALLYVASEKICFTERLKFTQTAGKGTDHS